MTTVDDHVARLDDLLAAGQRAAFHGAPGDARAPLQRAVEAARAAGREAEAATAAWLLGVAAAAAGRYGDALTLLVPMVDAAERAGATADPAQRRTAALAAATVASVHRQLGRHAAARVEDERGLALADGSAEAAFDCRLGLAADAVGLGDADTATAELEHATRLLPDDTGWWRQRLRLEWVRAEVALLRGDAAAAVPPAAAAVAAAEAADAPRHRAKSLLFLGVAQLQSGGVEAVDTLRAAAALAEELGTVPLVWPARSLLGALLAGSAPEESARHLEAARSAVLAIADGLPADLRAGWLDRGDVAALLQTG